MESKETIYVDRRGFQSQQKLYEEARKQGKTNSLNFVKGWYSKSIEQGDTMEVKCPLLPHLRVMSIK